MPKRYQVFLSSTFTDLKAERQAAMMALLALDAIPTGMELFNASDDAQWAYIRRVIDQCDYYVLIVGGRYGTRTTDGRSYTEVEFDYAVGKGLPILVFLKDMDAIPKSDIDDLVAVEQFRAKVSSDRMCKIVGTPEDLGWHLTLAFGQAKETHPRVGWVRGDEVVTPETSAEIATLRLHVRDLEDSLRAASGAPLVENL